VAEDRLGHLLEIAVQALDHPRRRKRLGERREAAQVREHDSALERDPAEPEVGVGPCQDLLDDCLRYEAGEDIPHALALESREQVVGAEGADRGEHERSERIDERDDPALVEGPLRHDEERQCGRE
jgi:hypothetical protein